MKKGERSALFPKNARGGGVNTNADGFAATARA
jgi:hypothetical protein